MDPVIAAIVAACRPIDDTPLTLLAELMRDEPTPTQMLARGPEIIEATEQLEALAINSRGVVQRCQSRLQPEPANRPPAGF